jgi:predicted ATPase
MSIRALSQSAFDGIVETLQFILPYASDLQPALTSELERNVYLQLTEADFKVPGWLLSTGTMRLVALLALLRHPTPPPLIVIEEIENGLDPRTIHLIVDEIRRVIESGKSQIIITTHSPYLLDLLHISQIVLVERDEIGQPVFSRPADQESLGEWAKKFSPGKLYTMGQLSSRSGE